MRPDESSERTVHRGVHKGYHWLTCTGDVYIATLLRLCPEVVLGWRLAVTSYDSGIRQLTTEERDAGWERRGEIAYSPRIESIDGLKFQRDGDDCPGFDEWYVFASHRDLGQIFHGNFFDSEPAPRRLLVFVNILGFVLHSTAPEAPELVDLFWKQMEWVQPESYIADGQDCFTIVSRNSTLLDRVHERLK
jgi:hypothetical protein